MKKLLFLGMALLGSFGAASVGGVSASNVSNGMETGSSSTVTVNTTEIYLKSNYASYYFNNLNENFGLNEKGSCGYVALTQMLSFWDTYWDDDLIPEDYDAVTYLSSDKVTKYLESPGIYSETASEDDMSHWEYIQKASALKDKYLHSFLIYRGYKDFYFYNMSATYPCGLTYDQLQTILRYYLYTYRGYTEDDYEILTETVSENVEDFTISMIKKGYPVEICMGQSNGNSGHAMIAYDYDETRNLIFVHPGWKDKLTHMSVYQTGYDVFWSATCIVPKMAHECSDNYVYTSGDYTNSHCACEIELVHDYTDHYAKYSSSKHKAYCSCGEYTLKPHIVGSSYMRRGHTYAKCMECGYVVDLGTTVAISSK